MEVDAVASGSKSLFQIKYFAPCLPLLLTGFLLSHTGSLWSDFQCFACIIYTHVSSSYCVLRFHYFSLFQGVLFVIQPASQAIAVQSAIQIHATSIPKYSISSPFQIPADKWLSLQHVILFIDLQAWKMKKNIDGSLFPVNFCLSVSRCGWLLDSLNVQPV